MSKKAKRLRRKAERRGARAERMKYHEDYHHFLFQKRHWQNGYAKALREHPYCGKYIPQFTLHRELHSKIHDVPCPNGKECRRAYFHLLEAEKNGEIDVKFDTAEQRLDFLIREWADDCPATVAILKWQKEVIHKFYSKNTKGG